MRSILTGPEGAAHPPLSPEAIDHALYVAGSHPVRALTLCAVVEEPGADVPPLAVLSRLNKATEGYAPPLRTGHYLSAITKYCDETLEPGRLVASTAPAGETRRRGAAGSATFRATPLGIAALAVVGVTAPWERDNPGLCLRDVAGSIRFDSSGKLQRSAGARFSVLSKLVDAPYGLAMSVITGGDATMERATKGLTHVGVLELLDKLKPEHRRVLVSAPPARVPSVFYTMSEEARATYLAAASLVRPGRPPREMSGAQLLDAIVQITPRVERGAVWNVLVRYVPQCVTFADDHIFGGKYLRSLYRLSPGHWGPIAELLKGMKDLKERPGAQEEAAAYAADLLHDGELTARLLAKGFAKQRSSAGGAFSAKAIVDVVPEDGILLRDLLPQMAKTRRMSAATLRNRLRATPGVHLEQRPIRAGGKKLAAWVTHDAAAASSWLKGEVRDDWQESAACKGMDMELFHPLGTAGPSAVQAEAAKQVCETCPVRLACLDEGMRHGWDGVWGGYTKQGRRTLPVMVRRVLAEVAAARQTD
ncbi:MAG TPA: WhiB family transcriptional regulator [Candidatus Saccharimonadales bacterium]|nr:WhiB family transcriptional regulator [Candidatus Saccharimonadales bacterium]